MFGLIFVYVIVIILVVAVFSGRGAIKVFSVLLMLPLLAVGFFAAVDRPNSANLYHLLTSDYHDYQNFVIGAGEKLEKPGTIIFRFMPEAAGYYDLVLLGPETTESMESPKEMGGLIALDVTDGHKTWTEDIVNPFVFITMYGESEKDERRYRTVVLLSTFAVPVSGWGLKPVEMSLDVKEPFLLDLSDGWQLAVKFRVLI